MSNIFTALITDEHTFAAWAEKELVKLHNEAPKIEAIADAVLSYAGPALQIVVTAELGAPSAAVVGKVITEAQTELLAASGLIADFGATPTATSVLTSVQNNLTGVLGFLTSPTSKTVINKIVTEIATLLKVLPVVTSVVAAVTAVA
jgi:hypothetical protein